MTQPKVPEKSPGDSVEQFAEILRRGSAGEINLLNRSLGLIEGIVTTRGLTPGEKVSRVVSALAAVEVVLGERSGLDYQRDTADGSEPGPRPAPHFESGS